MSSLFKKSSCLLVSLILLLFMTGCSVNPVNGKNVFNFYSEADEIKIGEEEHPRIISQYGEYDDSTLHDYIQKIVWKIGDVSHRPNLDYRVTVLDTPQVNAFALPGGHLYVCRGLLLYLNSEAELAAVLAHETGHVTARHSVESLSKQKGLNIGLVLGSLFFKTPEQGQSFYDVGSQLSAIASLSFSREDEMEADRLAVDYTYKAGFSPLGTEKVMIMLEQMYGSNSNPLFSVLSTHPVSEIRSKQARIEVRQLKERAGSINTELNRSRYLNAINSLALGNNPARGAVYGESYYNSTFALKYTPPRGFTVYPDIPDYLFAVEDEQKSKIIYFKMYPPEDAAEELRVLELEKKFKTKAVREATLFWKTNLGKVYIYLLRNADGNVQYQVTQYLVRTYPNLLEIIAYEKKTLESTDIDLISGITESLEPLTEAESTRLATLQKKLVIYTVGPNETWQSIADQNFPGKDPVLLAKMNGLTLNDALPEKIKLKLF